MPADDDSRSKEAFAGLHRESREQAPPFAPMRERALRATDGLSRAPNDLSARLGPMAVASATVLAVACIAWWMIARPAPQTPQMAAADDSVQRAGQLLDQIEQHLALSEALLSPAYPTDVLLIQSRPETTP